LTAAPLAVIERSGDRAVDHQAIVAAASEAEAERIVVGLPLSLSGRAGPAARAVADEVAELARTAGVPVEAFDERFTTVSAERALAAGGVRGPARRRRIDAAAAAVMLQSWLEARR
jgi:putative pre-16S rRNA nuclease